MSSQEAAEYARRLGAEIRTRRLTHGMSLRALAKELGLSGHGTLVDYEHGRRIPPEDLVAGCERIFQISDGALRNLRDKALAERANQQADLLLSRPSQPAAVAVTTAAEPTPNQPTEPGGRRRSRWRLVVIAVVVAVGLGIGVWRLTATPTTTAPRAQVPAVGRTVVAGWGICWGGQVARVQPTDAVTYSGVNTLQITVDKPNTAGDFAACTAHGLQTLHVGMKVTVYLQVPAAAATEGGVGFFVYDSKFRAAWAPETPDGYRVPLPNRTSWQKYVWTVPTVDTVRTLGMEVYSTTDRPLIVWLGAVAW